MKGRINMTLSKTIATVMRRICERSASTREVYI
ncbi:hypothetical protein O9A_00595 [Bartonella koehlerae C-29]|uniref:Uncharacterized protein n=1 Tax=Bartonella koehlerae C-29 TaxID=1134510 RepID=A0A067W5U1_9HYPH|nr:hypothetical protein O9A_00595 [Bartonella koehlerae C-29]